MLLILLMILPQNTLQRTWQKMIAVADELQIPNYIHLVLPPKGHQISITMQSLIGIDYQ
jgi:hypothetical protein